MQRQHRAEIARPLLQWFDHARRDLPWRARPGQIANPYHVLVSEAMLQQTQVTTVIPYFHRFIEVFPAIRDLAASDEQRVLRLWQGLGYYARARNLRKCAIAVVERFAGEIPRTVDQLLTLPGIGRYTAGAIASIAFDERAPIVDGNVVRVLCRLDAIEDDPKSKPVIDRLWSRAAELVPEQRAGDFNQAMMELGALVCTPKNPQCLLCPVRDFCRARELGRENEIPRVSKRIASPVYRRAVFVIERRSKGRNEWLIEQRPPTGRWAGMWQFPTCDAGETDDPLEAATRAGLKVSNVTPIGEVSHALTHRKYEFVVYRATLVGRSIGARIWVDRAALDTHPLSRPQLQAARLAGVFEDA